MIKHIVMWTLKDEFNGQNKAEISKELKHKLLDLKTKIPQIKTISVGINGVNFDKNHDVALVSEFESFADLEIYATHPDHMKVVQYVRQISTGRAAIDYTIE